jgi:hypothetical protein
METSVVSACLDDKYWGRGPEAGCVAGVPPVEHTCRGDSDSRYFVSPPLFLPLSTTDSVGCPAALTLFLSALSVVVVECGVAGEDGFLPRIWGSILEILESASENRDERIKRLCLALFSMIRFKGCSTREAAGGLVVVFDVEAVTGGTRTPLQVNAILQGLNTRKAHRKREGSLERNFFEVTGVGVDGPGGNMP